MQAIINNTVDNRKILRQHAREAIAKYSPLMTWLCLEPCGDLYIITEPQGQTTYNPGCDLILATTGDFYKAHGEGGIYDDDGNAVTTQRAYLIDLLGKKDYERLFEKAEVEAEVYDFEKIKDERYFW